ncbi:MAG TPA: hypothetical protein VJ276_24945, partial [Thermoanaerobaculia bacterium]|nr:hypothetical protein [Thermoanaerobaculia bacterium]
VSMTRLRFPVLMLILCAAALPALGDAGGTLTINGKTVQLKYGYATQREDPFDRKKKATQILITDQAIPPEAASDEFKLMEVRDKQKLNGVMVLITEEKQVVSGAVYSPLLKKMSFVSGVGMQKLELTTHKADRVAGRVWLEKPDDFFDNIYQYDVKFDLPVGVPKPDKPEQPKGTPLPSGGGDPGKAYDAYRKALIGGNIPVLRKSVAAERAKDMDSPEFKDQLKLIQAFQPKNVKVTGGAVEGDTATLLATAKDGDGTSNGTIIMVREAGAWKVSKESWRSRME